MKVNIASNDKDKIICVGRAQRGKARLETSSRPQIITTFELYY